MTIKETMTFEEVKETVEQLKELAEKQANEVRDLASFANGKVNAYDTVLYLFTLINGKSEIK